MRISHCPKCELRFAHRSEMVWHLREDHPAPAPATPAVTTIPVRRSTLSPERSALRNWWRWWGLLPR